MTFTTAEDEEVILEKLWHQVSTFQLEQSMTPTMEFAHLVAPIDFTTVEDTRDELQKFLDQIDVLPEPEVTEGASKYKDTEKLNAIRRIKAWIKESLQDTVIRLNETIILFENSDLLFTENDIEKRQAGLDEKDIEKRQAVAIAVGVGVLVTTIGALLHENAVKGILKKEVGIIQTEVRKNIILANNNAADILRMKEAVNQTFEHIALVDLEMKHLQNTQRYLAYDQSIQHFVRKTDMLLDAINRARVGEFDIHLMDLAGLRDSIKILEDKARAQGFYLGIRNIWDIQQLGTSMAYDRDNKKMYIIAHIPILKNSEVLNLYGYKNIPIILNNTILKITTKEKFLALDMPETQFQTFETLDDCQKYRELYICSNTIMYKKKAPSCLASIYFGQNDAIKKNCQIEIIDDISTIDKINASHYVITTSDAMDLTLSCQNGNPSKTSIQGSHLMKLGKNCMATSEIFSVSRPAAELGLTAEAKLFHCPITLMEWLHSANDEDTAKHLELAKEILKEVGQPVQLHQIKQLTIFDKKVREAQAEAEAKAWDISKWFKIPSFFGNWLSTLTSVIPTLLIVGCIGYACCWLRTVCPAPPSRRRRHQSLEEELQEFRQEDRQRYTMPGQDPASVPTLDQQPRYHRPLDRPPSPTTTTTSVQSSTTPPAWLDRRAQREELRISSGLGCP